MSILHLGSASEEALISRLRDGDEAAADALYERYAGAVAARCRRLTGVSDVDDLVQEVFERALRSVETFDPDRPVGPWLATIARHVAVDFNRNRGREQPTDDLEELDRAVAGVEESVLAAGRLTAVVGLVQDLDDVDQRVLLESSFGDRQVAAWAPDFGLTVGSARVKLHRIRVRLRAQVSEAGWMVAPLLWLRRRAAVSDRPWFASGIAVGGESIVALTALVAIVLLPGGATSDASAEPGLRPPSGTEVTVPGYADARARWLWQTRAIAPASPTPPPTPPTDDTQPAAGPPHKLASVEELSHGAVEVEEGYTSSWFIGTGDPEVVAVGVWMGEEGDESAPTPAGPDGEPIAGEEFKEACADDSLEPVVTCTGPEG